MRKGATSITVAKFKHHIEELKKEDEAISNWLINESLTHWSKAHFPTKLKCDMLLNNLCDFFNNATIRAKGKFILSLLEHIKV